MDGQVDRRDFLKAAAAAGATLALHQQLAGAASPTSATSGASSAPVNLRVGLSAPPLERVRIGLVGWGGRGGALLQNFLGVEGVDIKALCDVKPDRAAHAQAAVEKE